MVSNNKKEENKKDKFRYKYQYKYQLARLDRMFKFITQDERFKNLEMPLKVDIILSFFMHCWHLSDWLVKSEPASEKKVFNYANSTYELKVCNKLTNSTKHLGKINPNLPLPFDSLLAGVSFTIARGDFNPFARNQEEEKNQERLVILVDEKELPCFEFMKQCIEKWNEFLDKEGIDREITGLYTIERFMNQYAPQEDSDYIKLEPRET
jgi:hypothetical protein